MKQIKDLKITQVAQAGKIIEELFLDWDEYPSLSEDETVGPTLMESTTSRVHESGAWEHGAPATHPKSQNKLLKRTGPLRKKVKTSATEVFSNSELSNSVDSYSTCQSCCQLAKCSQEPAMTSPSVALKLPLHPPEACLLPLVPQHQAMVSLTTAVKVFSTVWQLITLLVNVIVIVRLYLKYLKSVSPNCWNHFT